MVRTPFRHAFLRPCRRQERGATVVMMAVFALMVFGFVGLAVDFTRVRSAAAQLQDTADAAALAAATTLYAEAKMPGSAPTFSFTRQKAIDVAKLNLAAGAEVQLKANTDNAANGDIVIGRWNPMTKAFVATTVAPNAVKVTAPRTGDSLGGQVPLLFGGPFQALSSDVARTSVASFQTASNPLIHVLDPSMSGALAMNGDPLIDVSEGGVQVNSDDNCAIHFSGGPTLTAGAINVVGDACLSSGLVNGPLHVGAALLPDPLTHILPTTSAWNALKTSLPKPAGGAGSIAASGTFNPGYYPKGMSLNSSESVTLKPGTYLFGGDVKLSGQGQVTGHGVTLLVDRDVELSVRGGVGIDLSPPTSGDLQGLVMMFHRETDSKLACSIGGNGVLAFDGTVYVPGGGVDLGGTGGAPKIGQIVCNRLSVSGTADLTGIEIVPPQGGASVYLVE